MYLGDFMERIIISGEYITLAQLLKVLSYISSGGQAKYFLADNKIFVNKKLEQKRGRKIYDKDIVKIDEKEYLIIDES